MPPPKSSPATPSRRAIIDLLSAPDYRPLNAEELQSALKVSGGDQAALRQLLKDLEKDGIVVQLKRKGYALAQSADLVAGTIRFTRAGSGIVTASDGSREVYCPSGETGTALPDDRVLVRISSKRERGPGRASLEGTVIRVTERRRRTIVGVLKKMSRIYYVKPMQASITHDIVVPETGGAQVGDRVLVNLLAWDEPNVSPEGEIVEVIGAADDASLDTLAVCRSYNLPDTFSEEAILEAEGISIDEAALEGRMDLRRKFVWTIDPATARDFDDALSIERATGGKWRLGVHIADVSHYIPMGSQLDREAIERGTSVYFPDRVVPMLPEQLSNGLCSLKPDVDRLCFSVFITLDDEGNICSTRFARSVIKSRLRLTYQEALAILETPEGSGYAAMKLNPGIVEKIKQVHVLAQKVRAKRMLDGALSMDMPEVKFILGKDGRIADVEPQENDVSHQLIEECMLMANEAVCRELSRLEIPLIHRIHDKPDPEKLAQLEESFLIFGWHLGDLSQPGTINRLLTMIRDLPEPEAWFSVVLRAMKRAMYSSERVGHYGLAKEYYSHFTSPIRRYPDLIVHRILGAVVAGKKSPYRKKELTELAQHCSEREQVATEAERELVDLKKMRYFAEQIESGEIQEFRAVVMDVRNFGMFVHIHQVQAYGLVHVSELSDDFYDFNPMGLELKGRRNGKVFRVGSVLKVIIAKVDMDKQQLDFQLVEVIESDGSHGKGGGRQDKGGGGRGKRGKQGKGGENRRRGRRR